MHSTESLFSIKIKIHSELYVEEPIKVIIRMWQVSTDINVDTQSSANPVKCVYYLESS